MLKEAELGKGPHYLQEAFLSVSRWGLRQAARVKSTTLGFLLPKQHFLLAQGQLGSHAGAMGEVGSLWCLKWRFPCSAAYRA